MKVREALAQGGLVPVDGRALLAHVLGRDRAWLLAHADDELARADADAFFALAGRRRAGEPVAYLTGRREFWGLDLAVTPAVLIPRPETETLVAAVLERLPRDAPSRILDLGTGSGAIALALAHERPRAEVLAIDASDAALDVARANAARLAIRNVAFLRSDWYAAVPPGRFEAIVANPPYVDAADPHLAQGDLRFEPRAALTAGAGLAAIARIAAGAAERLADAGLLAVEHGFDQADAVAGLLRDAGLSGIEARRDLAGHRRVTLARRAPGRAAERAGG